MRAVLALVIAETLPAVHRGAKVLEWRIPTKQAPTLNSYAYMRKWLKGYVMKALTDTLNKRIEQSPKALMHGARIQRWVRVTRFTPSRGKVDEVSCDAIGGKMPIDCLVHAGVLYDDAPKYLVREPLVMTTSRGNTHVLVEVFEMADDGTHENDVPKDALVEQVKKREGLLVRAIKKPVPLVVPTVRRRAAKKRAKH